MSQFLSPVKANKGRPSSLDSKSNVAIIVLGMHRSGTSVTAGLLHKLGCSGPKGIAEADEWNERGYFESRPIFQLNDEILAAAGSYWQDWKPLDPSWHASPRFNEFRIRAAELIRTEYGGSSLIYLKDPRICKIFPFWEKVLEDFGYHIYCIHTYRNAADVGASLQRRDGMNPHIVKLIWLRYMLDAEYATRRLPRVFTSYNEILNDWEGFIVKMERVFGFPFHPLSHQAIEDIRGFIDIRLKHHNVNSRPTSSLSSADLVQTSMNIFECWSSLGEAEKNYPALNAMRMQFDSCVPLFCNILQGLASSNKDLKREVESLKDMKSKLHRKIEDDHETVLEIKMQTEALRANLSEAEKINGSLQMYMGNVIEEKTRIELQKNNLEKQLSELQKTVGEVRSQLDDTVLDKAAIQKRCEHLEAKLNKQEQDNESLRDSAEHNFSRLKTLEEEMNVVTDHLIDRDKVIVQLRADKFHNENEIKNINDINNDLSKRIKSLNVKMSSVKQERLKLLEDHALELSDLRHIYTSSTSWRISAPMRWAVTFLRSGINFFRQ